MNLKQIAQKIGGYLQSKTQDDEGLIRRGQFTPLAPIDDKIKSTVSNIRIGSGPTLGQAFNQVTSRGTQAFNPYQGIAENKSNNAFLRGGADIVNQGLKSFTNMSTLGLVQPKMGERQTKAGLVGSIGGGLAGFAVNPLGKVMGSTDTLMARVAPKATSLTSKVLKGLSSEALQTLGYSGASLLGSKLGLNQQTGQFTPKDLASNMIFGSVIRGGLSGSSALAKGMNKVLKTIDEKTAAEIGTLKYNFDQKGNLNEIGRKDVDRIYEFVFGKLKKGQLAMSTGEKLRRLDEEANFQNIPNLLGIKGKDQSQISPESKGIKITETPKIKLKTIPLEQPTGPELRQRGFSASVQEAPNVSKKVKQEVLGGYEPKPNEQLMAEAKGLLEEGVTLDIKNIKDIDKKVAATIQEALNQQKAGNHQAAANLFNNLSEQGTELGRGVQAFSLLDNMSPEAIALSAAGKIKKYNQTAKAKIPELTGEQVKAISDKVAEADLLKGEARNKALFEINKMINEYIPSSLSDKALTVWKAGLLTSLRTHIRNFVGNTVHGVAETVKDIPATIADIGLSAKTGKRTITPTIKGTSEAWSKDTVDQMRSILGSGYDPDKIIEKFDTKQITWGKNLVEKGLKAYTDTVFRLLGSADKPFYNAAMARSLYSQAGAESINAGKRGNKVFIENLVKNPTEDMLKIAIGDANIATFKDKNKATQIASALKRAMATTKAGKVISEVTMPFTGVPGSVLGQIISYSPAGLIKGSIDAGRVSLGNIPELQRQAAQEIGRGVIGTGIFGLGSYLMSKGLMTGQPKDQEEQRQWELENKPRNSIMIGGKWRSLNSVGPEAVVFLAGSKLNEELSSPEGNLGTYGVKLGKDYLDQSFVQGLQGPVNAITDPNRYAKSYIGNQLSSVVPNIVKDVSKATDPYQREANTVMDYAKQGIPGARQTLTERRDVLGNIIPQEPTGGAAFVDIFNSKTPISNNVVNELSRLYNVGSGATPSKLSSSQTILKQKVKLTAEQLNQLEAGVGEELRPKLDTLISSPVYAQLDDEDKAKAIDKVVQSVRKEYKESMSSDFGIAKVEPSTKVSIKTTKTKIGKTKSKKKITFKTTNPKALPKITLKISSPVSRVKLKSAPKIKLSKTDNRKYTIKA